MDKIAVHQVRITGVHECQADDVQDAINKTIAYFAEHLTELNYEVITHDVWINSGEG